MSRRVRLLPVLAPSLMVLPLAACTAEVDLGDAEFVEHEVLVGLDPGDVEARAVLKSHYGYEELQFLPALGMARLSLNGQGEVREALALLRADPRLRYAEPNYTVQVAGAPSDPYYSQQWGLDLVHAEGAWSHATGAGVLVAVLDTGLREGGPDGIGDVSPGYDFAYGDSNPSDGYGHGTHVSGTIAQTTDNGRGVAGLAYDATVMPVKVLSDSGGGSMSAIASGVQWAADQGADVINMSLGSSSHSQALKDACVYAKSKGSVIVGATGNEGWNQVIYPAAYDEVIAVGAVGDSGGLSSFSNRGPEVSLVAPGGGSGILQEVYSGGWTYSAWTGTSMATPHVAAVAALVMEVGVTDPDEVQEILELTAEDRGGSGHDSSYGYGIVDAEAAVLEALARVGDSGWTPPEEEEDEADEPETGDPSDTTPPVISDVRAWTTSSQFGVLWDTDEPATSTIIFSHWGEYPDTDLVTEHEREFTGGPGSTYYFTIASTDAEGNSSTSGTWYVTLGY